MNPDELLPDMPPTASLRPFPSFANIYYKGHEHRIRTIGVSGDGRFLASGDESGLCLVFDVMSSRIVKRFQFGECVTGLTWTVDNMLVIVEDEHCWVINTCLFSKEDDQLIEDKILESQGSYQLETNHVCEWEFYTEDSTERENGFRIKIKLHGKASSIVVHNKGDYIGTVCPKASNNNQVLVHSLGKGASQRPFTKSKNNIQKVLFHNTKPFLFIATQRHVWIFNLQKQVMQKKLISGAKWYSSMDIHKSGDHIICGTYDRRLIWYDLDMGDKPYKTLKYHKRAIRSVKFSPNYPLFASSSDDGGINIFHSMIYSDLLTNALIVPLKVLKGHKIVDDLGVLDICFHPTQPWIFSAGSDHKLILWC